MIIDPASADPFTADVYSFGKTLWVLATGQGFPPDGHQPAGTRGHSIEDMRPHPHAAALDGLVDRATRIHPEERPSIADVAGDLRAWSQLAREPVSLDVRARRQALQEAMASEFAAADLLDQRKELAIVAMRRMNELFVPLNEALKGVHPRAQIDINADRFTQNMLSTRASLQSDEIVSKFQRLSQITSGPDYDVFALRLGRSLELTLSGALIFRSYVDVGDPKTSLTKFTWNSKDHRAPVGSVQADVMLEKAIAATASKLDEGIDAFIDYLRERAG
jgi:hypothetical protein